MKKTAVKSGAPYGVVGRGNAAKNILKYFRLLKVPYRSWHRSSGRPLARAVAPCRTVLLLIPDSAIAGFIAANPCLAGKTLVHFSGAFSYAGAHGLHPLAPLAGAGRRDFAAIPFAAEAGGPGLRELLPELPNREFRVKPADKPLYHALCVTGGNFPVLLWRRAFDGLRALGVPKADILRYFQASLDNFKADPAGALSGPLARGDGGTIAANLRALRGDPAEKIYRAFLKARKENR